MQVILGDDLAMTQKMEYARAKILGAYEIDQSLP